MSVFDLGIDFRTRGDKGMEQAFNRVAASSAKAEAGIQKVRKATDELGGAYRKATQALQLFGVAVGAAALNRMVSQYTEMRNKLLLVTSSQAEANRLLDDLNAIAGRTRAPLESIVTLYQRASMSSKELGASQKELQQFTENVGTALALQGGSIQDAQGALLQLSQALGGGVVRAEEFNAMVEGALPIVQAAARGIEGAGGSVAKLRSMMLEGTVTSKQFFDAILSQTDELREAFEKTSPTIGQAFQRLYDSSTMVIGGWDRMIGASAALAAAIYTVADNLQLLLSIGVATATFFATRYLIVMGVAFVAAARQAVTATIALEMALGATSRSAALASAGIKLASGALGLLRKAIVATGIGALVVGAGYLLDKFMDLMKATGGFSGALSALKDVALEVWQRIGDAFDYVTLSIKAGMAAAVDYVLSAFHDMVVYAGYYISKVAETINTVFNTNLSTANPLAEVGKEIYRTTVTFQDASERLAGEASAAWEAATAPLKSVEAINGKIAASAEAAGAGLGGGGAGGGLAGGAGKAKKATDELAKSAEKWRDRLKDTQTPLQKYGQELAELTELYQKGYLTQEEFAKGQRLLTDELADGIPLVGDLSNAIGEFVASGFKSLSDLGDAFRNMLKQMVVDAAKRQIMIAMGFSAGGAPPVVGTAGGAGSAGGALSGFGSVFAKDGWLMTGLGSGKGILGTIGGWLGMGGQAGAAAGTAGGIMGSLGSLGSMLGTAGAIIGGIGMVISIGKKLFGRELKDTGIQGTFSGSGFEGSTYKYYKGGLLRSNKTTTSELDSVVEETIGAAYLEVRKSVKNMASVLGLGSEAIRGFAHDFKISTKDMSEDEVLEALQTEMAKAGSGMAELVLGTDRYSKAGETALDTLTRLSTSLTTLNDAMTLLDSGFRVVGLRGADIASHLMDTFGGAEAFGTAVSDYWGRFYSEQEQSAILTRQAAAELRKYNVALPRSRAEYRALVDSIDLSDKKTHKLYAALLGLSGVMDQILPATDGLTKNLERLQARFSTTLDKVAEGLGEAIRANQASADSWRKVADGIGEYLTKLRTTASALISPLEARRNAGAEYRRLLGLARSGDVEAAGQLTGAAGTYLDRVGDTSKTAFEAAWAQARVMAELGGVAARAETTADKLDRVASLQQRQLDLIDRVRALLADGKTLSEEQLSVLQEKLGALDKQIQGVQVVGFDAAVTLLPERQMNRLEGAIDALRAAIVAETRRQEHEKATQRLNSYIRNLTTNKAGNTFVGDDDLTAMAKAIGLDTTGMSVNQVRSRLTNFNGNDLLKGTVYDPTGAKEQAYLDSLRGGPDTPKVTDPFQGFKLGYGWRGSQSGSWHQIVYGPLGGRRMFETGTSDSRGVEEWFKDMIEKKKFPAFARGGTHRGGPAYIGENDLELVAPSKIYSPTQTRQMLDNAPVVEQLKELRTELKALREENRVLQMQMADSTRKMNLRQQEWDVTGVPTRDV